MKLKYFFNIPVDVIYSKKETHTQTEVLKNQHCAYIKSKKNLQFHLKQVQLYYEIKICISVKYLCVIR